MSKKRKVPSAAAVERFRKAWIRDRDYDKYGRDDCVDDEFGQRIVHQPAVLPKRALSKNGRRKGKS